MKENTANITLNGKRQSFPSKIRNKARMLHFATSVQKSTGSSSQVRQGKEVKASKLESKIMLCFLKIWLLIYEDVIYF